MNDWPITITSFLTGFFLLINTKRFIRHPTSALIIGIFIGTFFSLSTSLLMDYIIPSKLHQFIPHTLILWNICRKLNVDGANEDFDSDDEFEC